MSAETQVAVTLYYLADEGRMRKVSNSFGLGKAAVSKVICRVTSVISEKRDPKYIVLPKTKEEFEEHVRNFYNRYGFPQCIGAVDGTHIKIKRPVDSPTDYVNRKGNFTFNCQVTVGYNYCFIDILIKWPGSAHDGWMYGSSSWDCLEMEPSQNAKESLSRGDLQYRYVSLGIQLILYYHF